MSMIPFLLSPIYLVYMLFTMDLVNCALCLAFPHV